MPTPLEFAARIKELYPDYASIDDMQLVARVLAKYPEYRTQVSFATPKEQFQTIQRGIRELNAANGALPGEKADAYANSPDAKGGLWGFIGPQGVVDQAIAQTVKDTPGFVGDAATRTATNIGTMVAHPIQTAKAMGESADPAKHASAAYDAAKAGNYGTAALEAAGALGGPLGSSLVEPAKQVGPEAMATLGGDRQQAANLLGDVGTAVVLDKLPGAAVEGVKTVAPKVAAQLGDVIPPKLMNVALKTGVKYFRFGADPGEALVGIKPDYLTGADGFKAPLRDKVEMLAKHVDTVLNTPAAASKLIDIIDPIETEISRAKTAAYHSGNDALVQRLGVLQERLVELATKTSNGRYAVPAEAQTIKRQIGELVQFSTDATEISANSVMQDIYSAIDRKIDEAVPAVKRLNEKLANAITAKKVVDNAAAFELKSDPMKLWSLLTGPYFRSRAAAMLRNKFGTPEPPLPETTPSPTYQPPPSGPLALPPGKTPLALPPAPEDGAYISSSAGLRRVGTMHGQMPGQDSAVFAPQSSIPMDSPVYPNSDLIQHFMNNLLTKQPPAGGALPTQGGGPLPRVGGDTLADLIFGGSADAAELPRGAMPLPVASTSNRPALPTPEASSTTNDRGQMVYGGGDPIGRAKWEMAHHGITSEQSDAYVPGISDVLQRGIFPNGYNYQSGGGIMERLKLLPHNLLRGRGQVSDSTDPREMILQSLSDPQREDAWRLYLGMPQENDTFGISDYRPTRGSQHGEKTPSYYFKINDFFGNLIRDTAVESGSNGFGDEGDGETDNAPLTRADIVRNLVESIAGHGGQMVDHDDFSGIMGDYTLSTGRDANGPYISYYDKWDLKSGTRASVPGVSLVGRPIEIYDRLYYDPRTFEPLNLPPQSPSAQSLSGQPQRKQMNPG